VDEGAVVEAVVEGIIEVAEVAEEEEPKEDRRRSLRKRTYWICPNTWINK
jgi:hypothetical protein